MLLADPMSRLNPLPNEELLDLQKVCLVRSSDEKLNPVYFGLILTRTLKLKCRSVKFVKKAKTHKPKKHWNHMKYPLDHGKLLVLIYSHGMGTNICLCVIITLSFPS